MASSKVQQTIEPAFKKAKISEELEEETENEKNSQNLSRASTEKVKTIQEEDQEEELFVKKSLMEGFHQVSWICGPVDVVCAKTEPAAFFTNKMMLMQILNTDLCGIFPSTEQDLTENFNKHTLGSEGLEGLVPGYFKSGLVCWMSTTEIEQVSSVLKEKAHVLGELFPKDSELENWTNLKVCSAERKFADMVKEKENLYVYFIKKVIPYREAGQIESDIFM